MIMGMKKCTLCWEMKPLYEFHPKSIYNSQPRAICKECHNLNSRAWSKNNMKKKKYNLSNSEWDEMFERQGKVCALCGTNETTRWCTDHDHETNIVRGILCLVCNHALGNYERMVKIPHLKDYLANGKKQLAAE
jgi:hypothetical protein